MTRAPRFEFSPKSSTVPRYGSHRDVIGLPARAIALSNSERQAEHCPLRWYYGHGLGLGSKSGAAASFGSAGHEGLEDVYRWWARFDGVYPAVGLETCLWCLPGRTWDLDGPETKDCKKCDGSGLGPVARIGNRWINGGEFVEDDTRDEDGRETPEHRVERLRRVLVDYLHVHGSTPPNGLRIVAVEVAVASPIYSPGTSTPYAPEVPIFRGPNGWRFARPTDPPDGIQTVRWPWYSLGKLDALAVQRGTRHGVVVEHKFVMDPVGYLDALTNDSQVPGYVGAADHAAQGGAWKFQGIDRVSGYLYDVAQSVYHHDPQTLKGGGFSVAKNRTVPSWRFEEAVRAAGVPRAPYADHIADLRVRIDPRLYRREDGAVGGQEIERWQHETAAIAARIAGHRRDVVRIGRANGDPAALAAMFPRNAVCKSPGVFCAHRGMCAAGAALPGSKAEQADGIVWADGE